MQHATAQPAKRLPVVGVIGAHRTDHMPWSEELGRWLAKLPVHLLTGGGQGVMAAVSRGFAGVSERKGLVLGVLPGKVDTPGAAPVGYPNAWVELPIRTHLPARGKKGEDALSRNHIVVLSADVVIALPGAAGTEAEISLALRYGKPIVGYRRPARAGVPDAQTLEELREFLHWQGIQ
jgi:uncharacterized protein (TIGR00725 family)